MTVTMTQPEHRPTPASGNIAFSAALTRRRFLIGAAGIATLALAACGGTPTATPVPSAAPSAAASAAPSRAASAAPSVAASAAASTAPSAAPSVAASASSSAASSATAANTPTRAAATPVAAATPLGPGTFPATVTHMYGTTTIPAAPKRVVSIGFNDQDSILALDLVPVGVLRWFANQPRAVGPWAEPKLGSATPFIFEGTAELDIEQVAKLTPDLIIGVYRDMKQEEYQRLSQIAPTIAAPPESTPFGVPWRDEARLIGGALGHTAAMNRIITGVEAKFDEAKRANPQFAGKTVVVSLPGTDGQYYAYSRQDGRVQFMQSIGLTLSSAIDALEKTAFFTTLSRERVNLLEADVLVFLVTTDATLQALKADTLLQGLNVAKQNRIIYITDLNVVYSYAMNSVLSLPYAIEQVVPQIAKVIK
jgi:iron complex transport system substrate-binding protein